MKKSIFLSVLLLLTTACRSGFFSSEYPEPDYERFVHNVTVAESSSSHVVYQYRNVRVDELAVLAALYCHDHGEKKAHLEKILLQPDNARRAYFICKL